MAPGAAKAKEHISRTKARLWNGRIDAESHRRERILVKDEELADTVAECQHASAVEPIEPIVPAAYSPGIISKAISISCDFSDIAPERSPSAPSSAPSQPRRRLVGEITGVLAAMTSAARRGSADTGITSPIIADEGRRSTEPAAANTAPRKLEARKLEVVGARPKSAGCGRLAKVTMPSGKRRLMTSEEPHACYVSPNRRPSIEEFFKQASKMPPGSLQEVVPASPRVPRPTSRARTSRPTSAATSARTTRPTSAGLVLGSTSVVAAETPRGTCPERPDNLMVTGMGHKQIIQHFTESKKSESHQTGFGDSSTDYNETEYNEYLSDPDSPRVSPRVKSKASQEPSSPGSREAKSSPSSPQGRNTPLISSVGQAGATETPASDKLESDAGKRPITGKVEQRTFTSSRGNAKQRRHCVSRAPSQEALSPRAPAGPRLAFT